MTRRPAAALPLAALLALLSAGCPAYITSGFFRRDDGPHASTVREQEGLPLRCAGEPCEGAPVEVTVQRGRSALAFWVLVGAELIGGTVLTSKGSLGAGATLNVLGVVDLVTAAFNTDTFRTSPRWQMRRPVSLDWHGLDVPLNLDDVVSTKASTAPGFFSARAALERRAIALPAAPRPAPAPLPAAPPPVATAGALAAALPARAKLAVLDLHSYAPDLAAESVRYFADLLRGAALKQVPRLEVMTRENLLVLLAASGRPIEQCEGECEVETARRIGADAVVSGELLKVGTQYKLTLRLHETRAGRLLSTAMASGRSVDELDASAAEAAGQLLAPVR